MRFFSTILVALASSDAFTINHSIPKSSFKRGFSRPHQMATEISNDLSESDSQNIFGIASDAATNSAFSFLHAFDDCGIKDSSKNLRVLWVRALLNQNGSIKDDVAKHFLPKTTRGLVTTEAGAKLFDPIVQFTEWIEARTTFIDGGLEHFLTSPVCTDPETGEKLECNVVLFGAGYDTRALRYRHKHNNKANFFEVDLPSVCEGKSKLYQKFHDEIDPDWEIEKYGSRVIPLDLNTCGGESPVSLIEVLRKNGLKKNIPTFFVWEAVLFYVNESAIRNIMSDLFAFAQPGGNGDSPKAETMLCFTDSLKPFVDVPFSNEAHNFFDKNGLELLDHRSRWGGAVHFALTASRSSDKKMGKIAQHVNSRVGGIVFSYTPTQSNNPKLLKNPSFDNVWYAVAYPWQIDGYETPFAAAMGHKSKETKPFATRIWGEPIVIYRDSNGDLVAMADVCPHRSVPLSMGVVEEGSLVCMYHGWRFGEEGACTEVPTLDTIHEKNDSGTKKSKEKYLKAVTRSNRENYRAVVEHNGLVYVWRGNVLEADLSLLPTRRKGDMESVAIDTVLDYNVDYSYIVENNLDSPHLFFLHDGSVPPIESIGMVNKNLPKLKLTLFQDDCGIGHLGRLGKTGRPKKLIRFDPPNIVRHGGVSGFEEEFHVSPVAPHRSRVLLRQHLPKGPILSTLSSIPFMIPLLTLLVNNWNYHIALEDSCVMLGQASRIEDWNSPRLKMGGLGDDLIKQFWQWRTKAHELDGTPYFSNFTHHFQGSIPTSIASGTSFGDDPKVVAAIRKQNAPLVANNDDINPATGNAVGAYGIKQDFLQNTPAANFPPINYKQYASMLVWDNVIKSLFKEKEIRTPFITKPSYSVKDLLRPTTSSISISLGNNATGVLAMPSPK